MPIFPIETEFSETMLHEPRADKSTKGETNQTLTLLR